MLSLNLLRTPYCILIRSLRKETSQHLSKCVVLRWLMHSETFIINNFLQNKWLKWEASKCLEVGLEAWLQIIWAGDSDRAARIGDWFGSVRDCEYGFGCQLTRSKSDRDLWDDTSSGRAAKSGSWAPLGWAADQKQVEVGTAGPLTGFEWSINCKNPCAEMQWVL